MGAPDKSGAPKFHFANLPASCATEVIVLSLREIADFYNSCRILKVLTCNAQLKGSIWWSSFLTLDVVSNSMENNSIQYHYIKFPTSIIF